MTDPNPTGQDDQQPPGGNSGFTPPATQDDLNRIIGERVTRERAKFADYDEFKTAAARVPDLEQQLADAQAAKDEIPGTVATQLKSHLIALHEIPQDDADLFLTATDPDTLLKQINGLVGRAKKNGNYVPREGTQSNPTANDERSFVRGLFGGDPT